MSKVTVTVGQNGSYRVEGEIELEDHEGNPLPTREGKPVYLCRCGASSNKPFCDGSHKTNGFTDPE